MPKKIAIGGIVIIGLAVGAAAIDPAPTECVTIDISTWERAEKQHFKGVSNFLIYQETNIEADPTWSVESFEEAESVEVCLEGADLSFLTGDDIKAQYHADRTRDAENAQVIETLVKDVIADPTKVDQIDEVREARIVAEEILRELGRKEFETVEEWKGFIEKLSTSL